MDGDYFNSSSSVASHPLPLPSDTPYETPLLSSSSRRSSGRASTISQTPLTPLPLPPDDFNVFNDKQPDRMSDIQQQDLTPSLHASLVSEILALRRENDAKDLFIDRLELSLSDERTNNESLHEQLKKNARETRSVKEQLKSIEESTLAALEELCHERDVANTTSSDLRKKLETSQKDLKAERENADRGERQWEAEKSRMSQENVALARRAQLAESRLKAVVEEVAAQQMLPHFEARNIQDGEETGPLGDGLHSVQSSPSKKRGHRRNKSSVSTVASIRHSADPNGLSLADELDGDEAEDDLLSDDEHLDARSKRNRDSRRSGLQDAKTRKVFGMFADLPEPRGDMSPIGALNALENKENQPPDAREESDPVPHGSVRRVVWQMEQSSQQPEVEANQRRKRDPIGQAAQQDARAQSEPLQKLVLNRMSIPESRPTTPSSPKSAEAFVSPVETDLQEPVEKMVMISSSTQTEEPATPSPSASVSTTRAPPPAPFEVPAISIHPPDSGPSSPVETVLPPRTKSVGSQTKTQEVPITRSTGMQTEIIRIDRRPVKLPPHLLPSALKFDEPVQGNQVRSEASSQAISPLPSPVDLHQGPSFDTGALALTDFGGFDAREGGWARLRHNLMMSARNIRSPDNDPFFGTADNTMAESDQAANLTSARVGKRAQKYTRPSFDPPTPVPEDEKVVSKPSTTRGSRRTSFDRSRNGPRSQSYAINSKGRDSWKYSKEGSVRSGSPTSVASSSAWSKFTGSPNPPVPIPPRTSSVGVRQKRGTRTTSPTPRASGASSPTKRSEGMRVNKKPILRKVKSAAVTSSEARLESSSQPLSVNSRTSFASTEQPHPQRSDSPAMQGISTHDRNSSTQTRRLSSFLPTGNASVGSSIQHTVVDAIAQTMVGEWMWKYVRKRKTFGISEPSADTPKAGETRHKRWVWLSPYERTVMWSTKQPTTEASLMGKSGRKLTIQSVLDVKDDSVNPKASRNVFNRSILILTPARALKFTAGSRDRHYLWLTALSFLAHHTSQGSLDLNLLPRPFASDPLPGSAVARSQVATTAPSRTESETASRSSRIPWSYKARSSKQSSGYGTPYIAEAPVEAETSQSGLNGTSADIPPQPTRAAPAIPTEQMFSDVALAPTIPRVPASRSSSRLNLHGRKRSASITGIITTYPSTRTNNSGTSSLRSFPTGTSGGGPNSSGAHSMRSGRGPSSAAGRDLGPTIHPPLPHGSIAAHHFASSSVGSGHGSGHDSRGINSHAASTQQPSTPILIGGAEPKFATPVRVDSRQETHHYSLPGYGTVGPNDMMSGSNNDSNLTRPSGHDAYTLGVDAPSPIDMDMELSSFRPSGDGEFGGNNSFFDAAGRARYTTASLESAGPGFSDDGRNSLGLDAAEAEGQSGVSRHERGESFDTFDSVAPPPITKRGTAGRGGSAAPPTVSWDDCPSDGRREQGRTTANGSAAPVGPKKRRWFG